jgi:RNA polymerase sigma-70 factor (ECF subfamily)
MLFDRALPMEVAMSERPVEPTVDAPTDEALLAGIAHRDEDAFRQLYDRYSPLLYAVCLRILRRPDDAQAALSDTLWEVWHHAERYNPNRGTARTYLVMLVRSRAIDRLRAESARHVVEMEFGQSREPDLAEWQQDEDPARLAIAEENSRLVAAALEELSAAQKRALQLAYFDGLTHREIAERLGAPLGSVKTHIRTGLARLGRALRTIGADWNEP